MLIKLHKRSSVKKVIGVVSGKGGVGKSTVTSLLACGMNRAGYKTAIMDADITGPSIPKAFGVKDGLYGTPEGLLVPATTKTGIDLVSVNLLLENATDPVLWRGPILGSVIQQFWSETLWENIDYMFVDMPPGTGDVPLTVFQSLPLDGIVIVTTPQELVGMIVEKAVNMARMMNVPILGLVENLSYLVCPDCGKKISVFGESHLMDIASKYSLPVLGTLPIDSGLAQACDNGTVEDRKENYLSDAVAVLENL
jgi:Mrp family chromosome partitioning ATPase